MKLNAKWSLAWANDAQTVLIVRVHDHLTWEEYRKGSRDVAKCITDVAHRVDVVYVCETGDSPLPPGGAPHHFRATLIEERPRNKGMCVLVQAPTLLASTVHMSLMAMGAGKSIRLVFANTVEEALRIIDRRQRISTGKG